MHHIVQHSVKLIDHLLKTSLKLTKTSLKLADDKWKIVTLRNGTKIHTKTDGTTIVKLPSGAKVQTNPDKTKIVTQTDGIQIVTHTNGTKVQINPDGIKIVTMPNGTKVQVNLDGIKIVTQTDGTKVQINPDGTKIVTQTNGIKIVMNTDGTKVQINPDKTKIVTRTDGIKVQINPDGTKVVMRTDATTGTTSKTVVTRAGDKIRIEPDGTLSHLKPRESCGPISETLVHRAARGGDKGLVETLIQASEDVDQPNKAANALEKERVVAAKIHRLRAVIDAQQALPTKETSKPYSSANSSKNAKKYTSHLAGTGFAKMRSQTEVSTCSYYTNEAAVRPPPPPPPPHVQFGRRANPGSVQKDAGSQRARELMPGFDEESAALARSRSVSATKKTIVHAASGKLPRIKEGTLQKKGLRTKLWSDRLVVLTKDVLAYSHTVRKTGGVIQVARINKVVAFKSDGYFGVFVEEPGKVHMFRCLDQVEMQEWHRQVQVVAHLQNSEIRTANKVIKEGELEKRGKKSRLWMKRRVYITGSEFRYSHGFFGDKKASTIPTNYINKITYQEYGGLCGFELRCDQGHAKIQEVVTFRTREPGQITEWLNALSTATGQPITRITGATDSIAGYIGSDAAAAAAEAPSLPFEDRDITYGEATL